MRTIRIMGALAVAAIAAAGCEEITNPVEETGEFAPPWVGFETLSGTGPHQAWVPIIFDAPTRPTEDVQIDYTLGGTAVFGTDYIVVADSGSMTAATGVTAAGGTAVIEADPSQEAHDTLWVYIPITGDAGSTLIVDMTAASTVDGDSVTLGRLGGRTQFEMLITAVPTDIETGTYTGTVTMVADPTGDFADAGFTGTFGQSVAVTEPEGGLTVAGGDYQYLLSDFSLGLFGVALAMPFNAFEDESLVFSEQQQHVGGLFTCSGAPITADISNASYDLDTDSFTFTVTWTSCGLDGASYTYTDMTLVP